MWKWIKDFITTHAVKSVSIVGLISGFQFLLNLLQALKDGVITDPEWHSLIGSANGIEALILGVIAVALKIGKKD